MNETLQAASLRVAEKVVEAEHDVQMQMLDSLAAAVENRGNFASMKLVLEQFIEFSDLHFLSEQLVMRLHSYPGYEAHMEEHTRLMKKLREIREKVFRDEKILGLELIKELRAWLLAHMASHDMAFGEFLKLSGRP
jgi:hemerythrin-like metal-binding protein